MGRVTKRSGRNGTSFHAVGGQELSELAGFEHLADDVAAAHELAFHIELWNCRPVGEPFDPLSQRRIAEHVDTLELDAEMAQHLHHDGRETALREDRRAFHKQHNIVVIDFALDAERKDGKNPVDSIYQACLLRFRPIMMTTMAALLGALPLALGTGTGSELRRPLGISIAGGLIVSQMLTLFTTPVIYLYFDRLAVRLTGGRPVNPIVPEAPAE